MRGLLCIDVPASEPLEPYSIVLDPKTWEGPWCYITDPELIANTSVLKTPDNTINQRIHPLDPVTSKNA